MQKCERDTPICAHCVSSGVHVGHRIVETMDILESKKGLIDKD